MDRRVQISRTIPSHPTGGEGRAASAAKGEGRLKGERGLLVATKRDEDGAQDPIQIFHHVGVGKSQDFITHHFKRPRPRYIVRLTTRVRVAVNLDDKTGRACRKICDIRGKQNLTLEFHTQPAGAEPIPEAALGFGQIRTEDFGAISRFDVPFDQSAPSPCPLSLKGERGTFDRHAFTSFENVGTVNA